MNIRPGNPDAEEESFLEECRGTLSALRSDYRHCPEPDLLLCADSEALPQELRNSLSAHIADCSLCRTLAGDLADPSLLDPTPEEVKRILTRLKGEELDKGGFRLLRLLRHPIPVVAVGVVLFIVLTTYLRQTPSPESPTVAETPTAEPVPALASVLILEKPPVQLDASTALLWRGSGEPSPDLAAAMGKALESYRADDYLSASVRFEEVQQKHPRAAAPAFYLGVCRMFLGDDNRAAADLERALELSGEATRQDASWYLGLAHYRAGNPERAAREMRGLCEGGGFRSARACAALEEISAKLAKTPER